MLYMSQWPLSYTYEKELKYFLSYLFGIFLKCQFLRDVEFFGCVNKLILELICVYEHSIYRKTYGYININLLNQCKRFIFVREKTCSGGIATL